MSVSRSPQRIVRIAGLLAGILLVCLALLLIPMHPSPEYAVANYDELAKIVNGYCRLPEKDALPDTDCSCFVYLKSRFSNKAVGYLLGFILVGLVYRLSEKFFGDKLPARIAALVLGLLLCYAFGTAWFMTVYARNSGPVGLETALGWCVFPFILPDLGKLALAMLLASRLRKVIRI